MFKLIMIWLLLVVAKFSQQQQTTLAAVDSTTAEKMTTETPANNTNNLSDTSIKSTALPINVSKSTTTEDSTGRTQEQTTAVPNLEDLPWERKELSLATIIPHEQDDNGCVYNAIKMAIDDINSVDKFITHIGQQSNTVKYDFKMKAYFGEVSNSVPEAIDTLHNTYKGSTKIATIGPPYKDLTNNFVEYSSVLGNTHISYVDANEPLQNFYVFFIQSTPSIDSQFRAAAAFLNHFNWTHAGIVYDFSDYKYRKNAGNLREKITKDNKFSRKGKILTEQGIWSKLIDPQNLASRMDSLQASGSRIMLSLVSVEGARKVFCEAYHRKMFKPKIVWILFETLPEDWASTKYDEKGIDGTHRVNCTEEQLLTAADGYISIIKQGLRRDDKKTISNMTADDFKVRLKKAVGNNVTCDENVAYAYDALWVLGKGYQALAKTQDLTIYRPHFYAFGYWFNSQLRSINFEALTGPLKYESVVPYIFKRVGQISIWVHKKGEKPQLVGTHKTADEFLDMNPDSQRILFGSNPVPSDRATVIKEYLDFDKPLYITLWAAAFFGVLIAIVFLVTAVVYMSDKLTNLDSPLLNCTIAVGSTLCYISVVIYGLDTRYVSRDFIPNICYIFLCTLSVGFTLTFGGLFTKTWRLYKTFMTPSIVNNKQSEPKHIPEWLLVLMIGVFLLIDAIILISWGVFTPFYSKVHNVTQTENPFADVMVVEQIVRCNCNYFTQAVIGVCCYKGVLLIFGIFLAWQTKNAKIQVQNESRQIALAIYNVVVVSIIGVICASVLLTTTKHQALYAIVSVCIFICTTFTLLLVFIPKLRKILFPRTLKDNERKVTKDSVSNGIYLKNNKKMQAGNRFSGDMSSSYSSATLNTQLSTDSTQHIPNIYHHNSLVDKLSAGSVVSYTSAYLGTQQPGDVVDQTEPQPKSGIYVGMTIAEELNESQYDVGVINNKEINHIVEKVTEDDGDDNDDKEKIEVKSHSSDVSEAEDCLEMQKVDSSSYEKDSPVLMKKEIQ